MFRYVIEKRKIFISKGKGKSTPKGEPLDEAHVGPPRGFYLEGVKLRNTVYSRHSHIQAIDRVGHRQQSRVDRRRTADATQYAISQLD